MGGVDHDHPVVDGPHLSVDCKKRQTVKDKTKLQHGILIVHLFRDFVDPVMLTSAGP